LLELDIDGHVTYMGPNGAVRNRDTLMVSVWEWPEESAAAATVR